MIQQKRTIKVSTMPEQTENQPFRMENIDGMFPAVENTPAPESIATLADGARWNGVPAAYQMHEFNARGRTNIFHGREHELSRLEAAYKPRTTIDQETNHQTMLLYGAQGAGKSTLLEEAGQRLRERGVAAVHLHRTAFTSTDEFVKQLTESTLWAEATQLQRLGERARDIEQTATANVLTADIASQLQEWGVTSAAAHVGLLTGGMRLDTTTPPTAAEALQRLDNAFEHGWVICTDEVQGWRGLVGNTDSVRLVSIVGDPTARKNIGRSRSGGLIVAGHADSDRILRALGLTRIDHMRVGALDRTTTWQVMADHAAAHTASLTVRAPIQNRWLLTLANQFHVWPHHTTCAVRAMERALQNMHESWVENGQPAVHWQDHDRELEWVRTVAASGVAKLYDERRQDALVEQGDGLVLDLVLLMAEAPESIAHRNCIADLAIRHRPATPTDETEELLLHSGLLEPVMTEGDVMTNYLRIPIPSLATYIRETSGTTANPEWIRAALAAEPKDSDRPMPPAELVTETFDPSTDLDSDTA